MCEGEVMVVEVLMDVEVLVGEVNAVVALGMCMCFIVYVWLCIIM